MGDKKKKAKKGIDAANKDCGDGDVGVVVKDCPKKAKGSILVVLKRSDNLKLKENHKVRLVKNGADVATKTTSSNKVTFTGLDPDNYTVITTLSTKLRGAVIHGSDDNQGVAVVAQKESRVDVLVDPLTLTVEVVLEDTKAFADGVKITISGGASAKKTSAGAVGTIFEEPKLGAKHHIALDLPKAINEDYAVPKTIPDADMPAAAPLVVRIELPLRPAPVIEIADPKVVIVPHAYHGQPKPGVNAHRVPVTLKSDRAYDGEGVFSCAPDHIEVFAAAADKVALAMPLTVVQADLVGGKTVFIQAKTHSGSKEGTSLKFKLQSGTVDPKPEVTEKITCVKLQLNIFKTPKKVGKSSTKLTDAIKLDPGRPIVLQKKVDDIFFSERTKLQLERALPHNFDGELNLEALAGGTSLFASNQEEAETGHVALAGPALVFKNTDINASNGKVLWVEGTAVSAAVGDTGWKTGVEGIAGEEGDRVTITVIQADLELSQSRTVIPANGAPAALVDQFKDGRYVHKQKDQFHGRARLILKQVLPAAFIGTLTLDCFHVKHKGKYSGSKASSGQRLKIFATEVPAAGDAAQAYPVEIAHDAAYPAAGKEYWVEGSDVSKDLRDCEIRLGVKEYEKGSDRAAFTVVRLTKLNAKIPATRPNITRKVSNGGASNGPVKGYEFLAGKNNDAKHYSTDFAVNDYLPVVMGSLGADLIELTVKVEPKGKDVPVKWDAVRNTADAAGIATLAGNSAQPTVTQDGADLLKATLSSDAGGSFHVIAFVDGNGDSKFNFADAAGVRIDREPYVSLNVIMYYVMGIANNTITRNTAGTNGTRKVVQGAFNIPRSLSTGDFLGAGNDAIDMDATVQVVGGGADGQLGLNKLFGGWLNNETNCPSSPGPGGFGEDVTSRYSSWPPAVPPIPAAVIGQTRCLWRQGATAITGPMLDSGYANQGTGGESCTGTAGANAGTPQSDVVDPTGIGRRRRYFNVDSPGGGIRLTHPTNNNLFLTQFSFNIDFQCALIFWTGERAPSKKPCGRLYATAYTNTWNIRFTANYAISTLVEAVAVGPTVAAVLDGNRVASAVDGSGIETRRPDGLNNLVTDEVF
jgi:hypothetical protein